MSELNEQGPDAPGPPAKGLAPAKQAPVRYDARKNPGNLRSLEAIIGDHLTDDQKKILQGPGGKFAVGTSSHGRRKGALSRVSENTLIEYERMAAVLGIKSNPLVLLQMVVADDHVPLDLRVSAAKALASVLAPKMLEVNNNFTEPSEQREGLLAAVARDPHLRRLAEAYLQSQVAAEQAKILSRQPDGSYAESEAPAPDAPFRLPGKGRF
jgi:hypothetical protein